MLEQLKHDVCAANKQLAEYGLAILTWGNVSGIDRDRGLVVIKPSGVAYTDLTPEMMVVVGLDGAVVEGDLRPSSDTPTHIELYKAFPEIGGVCHTHSAYATAFAQAGKGIPALGTTHADTFYGEIPCTHWLREDETRRDYEANTGAIIAEVFKTNNINPDRIPAVLVRGHGPFAWGKDAAAAAETAYILEETAKIAAFTFTINPNADMLPQYMLDRHFFRKHGAAAYYGQTKQR